MKEKKTSPAHKALCGTIICIALALVAFGVVTNINVYLLSAVVKVQAPSSFSFPAYNELLKKYVRKGLVDYKALKGSKELQSAMDEIAATSPDNLSPEERECYWLNVDNLLMIKLIADKYPVENIDELKFDKGTRNFVIGGKIMTFKDVDLRHVQGYVTDGEWRVLFSRITGALGGPNLLNHAFTAETLENDLNRNVRNFAIRPDNWFFEADMDRLHLSKFYRWYSSDLEEKFTPIPLINQRLPEDEKLAETVLVMHDLKFDYRINDIAWFDPGASSASTEQGAANPAARASQAVSPTTAPESAAATSKGNEASTAAISPAVTTKVAVPAMTIPGAEKGK